METRELLDRATAHDGAALRAILFDDRADDWTWVRELGEYVAGLVPDDSVSRLLIARASHHLGDYARAAEELERCAFFTDCTSDKDLFALLEAERVVLAAARRSPFPESPQTS